MENMVENNEQVLAASRNLESWAAEYVVSCAGIIRKAIFTLKRCNLSNGIKPSILYQVWKSDSHQQNGGEKTCILPVIEKRGQDLLAISFEDMLVDP